MQTRFFQPSACKSKGAARLQFLCVALLAVLAWPRASHAQEARESTSDGSATAPEAREGTSDGSATAQPSEPAFYTRVSKLPAETAAQDMPVFVPSSGEPGTPVVLPPPPLDPDLTVPSATDAPLPAAPSMPSAPSGGRQPNTTVQITAVATGPRAVERVLESRLGHAKFSAFMQRIGAIDVRQCDGHGAPCVSVVFDQASVWLGAPGLPVNGMGTGSRFFEGTPAQGKYLGSPPQDAEDLRKAYNDHVPGGVALEGAAVLDSLVSVGYDARFNALVLNETTVYFVPVSRADLAILCRAIAEDGRVAVSLADTSPVFGVPSSSNVALDMKIVDNFLLSIVFHQGMWTGGYRFPKGFAKGNRPHAGQDSQNALVLFSFTGFHFGIANGQLAPSKETLDVRLYPLTKDGQPDEDAAAQGRLSPQYVANASNIAQSVPHYRKERIINKMFLLGEAAAVLRGLRASGFDLAALADHVAPAPDSGD